MLRTIFGLPPTNPPQFQVVVSDCDFNVMISKMKAFIMIKMNILMLHFLLCLPAGTDKFKISQTCEKNLLRNL